MISRALAFLALAAGGCSTSASGNAVCEDGFIPCPPVNFDAGDLLGGNQYTPECVNPNTSPQNCGACGVKCPINTVCVNGACGCGTKGSECAVNNPTNVCCSGLHCGGAINGTIVGTCQ